eukprot:gene22400-28522_t
MWLMHSLEKKGEIQIHFPQSRYLISNFDYKALDVIRKLREIMPIVRANMLLRVVCLVSELESIRTELVTLGAVIVADSSNTPETKAESDDHPHKSHPLQQQCFMDLRVDPESFRRVEEIVAEKTTGAGRVEVIQLRVANSLSTSTAVAASTQQTQGGNHDDNGGTVVVDGAKTSAVSKNAGKAVKGKRANNIEQQILSSSAGLSGLRDSDEEEEEAIGIVRKEKKKGRGKKAVAAPVPQPSQSDSEEAQEDGADSDDEALQMALAVSASLVEDVKHKHDAQSSSSANNKKGKKNKRLEKEELKERELKASVLRERAQQQQHVFATAEASASSATTSVPVATGAAPASGSAVQSCNTCGGAFHDVKDYRTHFKSEWHRHNLSRKMKGLSLVGSEEAFLSLSLEELEL